MPLSFVPLAKEHDRSGFRCGEGELDEWFRKRAGQDVRRNVARVFVALDESGIAGFYSLSAFTLSLDEVPESLAGKLPRYDRIIIDTAPTSMPLVAMNNRCELMRLSSASSMRIHVARSGISMPSSSSTAIEKTISLCSGER